MNPDHELKHTTTTAGVILKNNINASLGIEHISRTTTEKCPKFILIRYREMVR